MAKGKYVNCIEMVALLLALSLTGCGANDVSGVLDEQRATINTAMEEVGQKSLQNKEKQGVLGESESDSDEQDTQEEFKISETESTTESETETNEVPSEENADLYNFGPVSYDLSTLPAMENKLYAEWEGNIYFRQYSDEDIEKGALWANFANIPDTEKEIMCLEPDGTLTQARTTGVGQCTS